MGKPTIHPNWSVTPRLLTDGYSLEITAKNVESLRAASPRVDPETPVAITFLPGEEFAARVAATRAVRELGLEPMPHFSARRITSAAEFENYLGTVVEQAQVRRCFVVAGDPSEPAGPFADSSDLIASGAFERCGIKAIGIGGHPEGHPNMSRSETWAVLERKCAAAASRPSTGRCGSTSTPSAALKER